MPVSDNLLFLLDRFCQLGSECAFVYRRGYRRLRWSYGKIARVARQFARELERRSVGKGDRVLLWGDNSAEWVAVFFGCVLRGAVVVPMDRAAAPGFARRVAEQVEAKLVVCSRDLADVLSSEIVAQEIVTQQIILEDLGDLVSGHDTGPYDSPPLSLEDTLEIVFTSGTTAEPKGVLLSHGNVLANLEPLDREIAKYRKYERAFHPLRFVNLLPLSHVFGQFLGLFVPQSLGATVVFHDSLNPAEVIRTIREERASVLIAVPRLLESLRQKLERDREERGKLDGFRRTLEEAEGKHFLKRWWTFRNVHSEFGWKFWAFISGGAALDEQTERFWTRLAFAVVQGYGMTETTSLISVNHPFKVGKRSIGKVLPGREMKLDPATGEILVRGGSVTTGYWRDKSAPAGAGDGWFHTGDLGELDAEGNLYFKGRTKTVIVTPAGMNVYPEDLESALRRGPAVRDCVVVALPVDGNAEPCAVILLNAHDEGEADQIAADAVRSANLRLAEYQWIHRWMVWPEQDFPRTSTQKPRTAEIAEYVRRYFVSGDVHPDAPSGTVAELIERITKRKVGAIAPDARLESDLNLSSIDRVELMSALEDRLQTELDESGISQATTVGELEGLLQAARAAATGSENSVSDHYHYPHWAQRWPHTWIRPIIYYALTWPATMLLAKPRVVGRENLREIHGPVLVVCNHVTYIDIGFVMAALPATMRTHLATAMQGERLMAMRRGGSGINGDTATPNLLVRSVYKLAYALTVALFNVFPLPQRNGFRKSFEFAGQSADRGYSMVVFPEGQRTNSGDLQPFQSGIGLLATKLNLPVVPMRIDGLREAAQEGSHFVPPNRITVHIGKPVTYNANAAPETIAQDLERRVREL